MRRLLLSVALLALIAPATADAAWPRVERAQALAERWWGETPTCGRIWHLRSETDDLADARLGYNLSALHPNWAGVGDPIFCVIHLRRSWLATRPTWGSFCSTYLHEYGHVLGREHSDDPRDVMHSPPPSIRAC